MIEQRTSPPDFLTGFRDAIFSRIQDLGGDVGRALRFVARLHTNS
jgi:hypothetical protein